MQNPHLGHSSIERGAASEAERLVANGARELNLIAGAYARIAVEPAAVRVMCVWMSGDE